MSTSSLPLTDSKSRVSTDVLTLAVDIGGSHIKALVLGPTGDVVRQRISLPTPAPAVPAAVLDVIEKLALQLLPFDRIAVGFPGVVQKGTTRTAPNLSPEWKDVFLEGEIERRLNIPVRVANDADIQGFGAIAGKGVELVLTLGTGMGSALFVDGILVPNLELPHHPFEEGRTYEEQLGQAALERMGREAWKLSLNRAIHLLSATFNFDKLYIGGGNARLLQADDYSEVVEIVPNILGLLGGLALWTSVHGTSLVRAPHSEGAYCLVEESPFEGTPGVKN